MWPKLEDAEKQRWLQQASGDKPSVSSSSTQAPVETEASEPADKRRKSFNELKPKAQKVHVNEICNVLASSGDTDHAVALLVASIRKMSDQWPRFVEDIVRGLGGQVPLTNPSKCDACEQTLTGLFEFPEFAQPNPSRNVYDLRAKIDKVARNVFQDRQRLHDLGYKIGERRWQQAGSDLVSEPKKRGRPSMVNNPALVETVKAVLQGHAQPSSDPCLNSSKEWVPSQVLTKKQSAIFEDNDALQQQMSAREPWC